MTAASGDDVASSPEVCAIPECGRRKMALGLCSTHYRRQREGSDMTAPIQTRRQPLNRKPRGPNGRGSINDKGYRQIFVNGVRRTEHQVVMEAALGRALAPGESVHHKNGVRHDNRLENLELWAKPQPTGQRVTDLVRWVVERYPDLVRAEQWRATRRSPGRCHTAGRHNGCLILCELDAGHPGAHSADPTGKADIDWSPTAADVVQ